MHLVVITGFLGSGKTTFIVKLAKAAMQKGMKVAIVVNEIGATGIDDQFMKKLVSMSGKSWEGVFAARSQEILFEFSGNTRAITHPMLSSLSLPERQARETFSEPLA